MKRLTNTVKHTHLNEQNTYKISYLGGEEFHTPHALSLYNFYLWYLEDLKREKILGELLRVSEISLYGN